LSARQYILPVIPTFALYQGATLEVAEKPEFFEGDGLQAVHNCFAVNAALAAEGAIFSQSRLFPQPV
jgi:hypothetical protein